MNKNIIIVVLVVVIFAIGGYFIFMKQGSAPIVSQSENKRPGEFSNGQRYQIYQTNNFEVKYPYWPNVDKKNILEPENIKLAVANEGCNFLISSISIPKGTTFKDYINQRLQESNNKYDKYGIKITKITKDIKDTSAYIESEFVVNNVAVKSVSYGYFTSQGVSYGIAFIAEKNNFDKVCQPLIKEVIESVKIK